ncbi:MAG TPA: hypothetical protein VMN60_04285 [Longimicrobiales bacterium]|nr:hypothetical protein [Longimicrobiales bacterium]
MHKRVGHRKTRWWRIASALAIVAATVAVVMGTLPDAKDPKYGDHIRKAGAALQFSYSPEEAKQRLDTAEQHGKIGEARKSIAQDYIFVIPIYVLVFLLMAQSAHRRGARKAALLIAIAILLAAAVDVLENLHMSAIIDRHAGGVSPAGFAAVHRRMHWLMSVKWTAIFVAMLGACVLFGPGSRAAIPNRALGIVISLVFGAGALVGLAGVFTHHGRLVWQYAGSALLFGMMIYAVLRMLRPDDV